MTDSCHVSSSVWLVGLVSLNNSINSWIHCNLVEECNELVLTSVTERSQAEQLTSPCVQATYISIIPNLA
jgi:hypothetical protein